ncbi:hypothetical protein HY522_04230 [bacterium]|nr:hypothetical protein [bacterium]
MTKGLPRIRRDAAGEVQAPDDFFVALKEATMEIRSRATRPEIPYKLLMNSAIRKVSIKGRG